MKVNELPKKTKQTDIKYNEMKLFGKTNGGRLEYIHVIEYYFTSRKSKSV
jgi:hypothetical protein